MPFLLLLAFAILPSLAWLLFFLRRDDNPEPHRMIIKVFLFGALMTVPAFAGQYLIGSLSLGFLFYLIASAFIEEIAKYGAAFWGAFKFPDFDEPVDAMIYLITAGLGFAAMENLIVLINPHIATFSLLAGASAMRFLTATFVHALTSGLLGYFIGLQFYKKKKGLIVFGIIVAVAVHAIYNIMILSLTTRIDNYTYLAYNLLVIIPLALGILDIIAFNHLKKITKHQHG
jgi:protease PrsW